jgi:hypothetical protein
MELITPRPNLTTFFKNGRLVMLERRRGGQQRNEFSADALDDGGV